MTRVLVIAHGHPELSVGGGEIAAGQQCRELRRQGHTVLFMARTQALGAHCGTPFSVLGEDVLFHSPNYDHFLHSQRAKWAVYKQFRSLLERFAPDVVHFHHYVFLGLEMIREVRKYADQAGRRVPIVVTLHEYLAICNNHGQMVKTDGRLCERASPASCHVCFPDHPPQDFFLRETFIKSFFGLVDAFVCPSNFLLERYAAWGIPREKLHLGDNGQIVPAAAEVPEETPDRHRRFAYFGQVTELKGVFVFIDAVRALPPALRERLVFEIYGTTQHQGDEFRARLAEALAVAGDAIRYYGPYRHTDLPVLMRRTGWVVVPSTWWENSPLVIQEAFANRCPVICGDVGGMAEKVVHLGDGLQFIAGNSGDLARRLEQAADPVLFARLQAGIRAPRSIAQATVDLLALYRSFAASAAVPATVLASRRRRGSASS